MIDKKQKVCIGGTFNILHIGHKRLIDKAVEIIDESGYLLIGLSNGKLVKNKKNVKPFNERKKNIERYLNGKYEKLRYEVIKINDKYGPTLKKDFDFIVVSPETKDNAEEINKKRKKLGKKPIGIIMIPYVVSNDGIPISSTRIIDGEIDKNGRVIKRD